MHRLFIILSVILMITVQCTADTEINKKFLVALESAVNNTSFSDQELNDIMAEYSNLLFPHSDTERLFDNVAGIPMSDFPLAGLKDSDLYKRSIDRLFDSDNSNQRLLSYLILAAANDSSLNNKMLVRLDTEERPGNKIWAFMALLYLKDTHTDKFFDFMVKNETLGDAHMLPLFSQLDPDLLRKTALKKISLKDSKSRILAAATLGVTGYTLETEKALRKAVKEWSVELKGYPINSLIEIRAANLLDLIKPYINNKILRTIALKALASSPTRADNDYIFAMMPQKGVVSKELLDAVYLSENPMSLQLWLQIVQENRLPQEYYFSVMDSKLICSDTFKDNVISALKNIKNPEVLAELIRVFEGKYDSDATNTLIFYLRHPDETVRYWAASSLRGNKSENVLNESMALIKDPRYRTTAITNLILENKIDGLQATFDEILKENWDDLDWRRSCIEYLTQYPREYHKVIFREIIGNDTEDESIIQNVCRVLVRMKDQESATILGEAMLRQIKTNQFKALLYLGSLGRLKGDQARKYIEMVTDCDIPQIREIATKFIENWDK